MRQSIHRLKEGKDPHDPCRFIDAFNGQNLALLRPVEHETRKHFYFLRVLLEKRVQHEIARRVDVTFLRVNANAHCKFLLEKRYQDALEVDSIVD